MTIFERIRIRRILRNKKTYRIGLDHAFINKDVLKYYYNILPKYGFTLVDQKTGNDQSDKSYWCNKNRAKNSYFFTCIPTCYADNEILMDQHKLVPCEACAYYSKCFN